MIDGSEEHEHLHLFADGLRAFTHSHAHPVSGLGQQAAWDHAHENGRHAHRNPANR